MTYRVLGLNINEVNMNVGFAIIECLNNSTRMQKVQMGYLQNSSDNDKLTLLYNTVEMLHRDYDLDAISVKVTKNSMVANMKGALFQLASTHNIVLSKHNKTKMNMAIAGTNIVKREHFEELVKIYLDIKVVPEPEQVIDALALAITEIHHYQQNKVQMLEKRISSH